MYMKMVGLDYLEFVLGDLITDVMNDKESCEVDPSRLSRGEDLKKNQKRLINYCKAFLDRITESINRCPEYGAHAFCRRVCDDDGPRGARGGEGGLLAPAGMGESLREMKHIFANIQTEVKRKFPEGIECYTAVSCVHQGRMASQVSWPGLTRSLRPLRWTLCAASSGFIFLRFFCPAILNPALFGLSGGACSSAFLAPPPPEPPGWLMGSLDCLRCARVLVCRDSYRPSRAHAYPHRQSDPELGQPRHRV